MVDAYWGRIAGIHSQGDGVVGAVWLAHDKDADVVRVYDAYTFRRQPLAVLADGLIRRGKWVPIAWPKSASVLSKNLLDRGCNMLHEPSDESIEASDVLTREIVERMNSGRFHAVKHLQSWVDEAQSFARAEGRVPLEGRPLIAATCHAYAQLEYARCQSSNRKTNYRPVAIV
jgi:hypothetical protein